MENNNSMEEMLKEYEDSFKVPRRGDILKGKIVQVTEKEVVVNIGYKSDGIIPKDELSNDPDEAMKKINIDDEVNVYVIKTDDGEGNVLLSLKRVSMFKDWQELEELYGKEEIIDVVVKEAVKGGVIAFYKEIKGFIPASHLAVNYVRNMAKFVGETLPVKILEIDMRRKKVVFSHKEIAAKELEAKKTKLWAALEASDLITGEVKRITNFGVFVDIGGIDGLIHVSELSWGRVNNPKDIVKVGDNVEAKVLSYDKETEKISLSLKQMTPDPWSTFETKYNLEDAYDAKVVNLTDFGAFVELEPGIEGLVHISQISHDRIEKPSDVLKVNDVVKVKLIEKDAETKKVKLSIKATIEKQAEEVESADEE